MISSKRLYDTRKIEGAVDGWNNSHKANSADRPRRGASGKEEVKSSVITHNSSVTDEQNLEYGQFLSVR